MKSLLLDVDAWDLVLDVNGNIAVASNPYALAQDAACAIKLFQGELWYDTAPGVPYFARILGPGVAPPLALVKELMVEAAMRVPGVVEAQCYISGISSETRQLTGQVQVTDTTGKVLTATF